MTDFVARHRSEDFVEAATIADGLQTLLDGLWEANDLATMALHQDAFGAYRDAAKEAGASPAEVLRRFGFASFLRDRLVAAGWTPPR